MATLTILYGHPEDPVAFEDYYANRHLPWATKTMPGVQGAQLRRVLGAPGGNPLYYRIAEMTWPDHDALQAALATDEGKAVLADTENFATGGAVMLVGQEDQPA